MAHENCLGEGAKEWTSWLTPTGGQQKEDGKLEIKEVSNQLKGKHKKTGSDLENIVCDGTNISFSRVETRAGGDVRVFYENGKITKAPSVNKVRIKGTYREAPVETDAAGERSESATSQTGVVDAESGDWQAEKPGGA